MSASVVAATRAMSELAGCNRTCGGYVGNVANNGLSRLPRYYGLHQSQFCGTNACEDPLNAGGFQPEHALK